MFDFGWSVWLPLTGGCVYLLYRKLTEGFDVFKKKGIPGPKPYPFMGTMNTYIKIGILDGDTHFHKTYGKVVGIFRAQKPGLLVADLDILKEIFVKQFPKFQNHTVYLIDDYILRKMITVAEFDHWKHIRNTISPVFTGGKLRNMTHSINNCCHTLVNHLKAKCDKDEVTDFKKQCGYFTMDVIATTAFGMDVDSSNNPENEMVKHVDKILGTFSGGFSLKLILLMFMPKVAKALGYSFFDQSIMSYFGKFVENAMKQREEDDSNAKDFLGIVANLHVEDPLEKDLGTNPDLVKGESGVVYSKSGLSTEEIIASSFLFFLAGYETTATGLSLLFYNLACYPEEQEKLYQEIIEVMGEQEEPDYDIIKKMPYLNMCLDESLRLYPPASRNERMCNEDVEINGVQIDKGMSINVSPWYIHRDPEIYPDPEKFIPERMTPEEKAARHPMAWMPFGHGPRNCIGMRLALMEIKFAVIHVLKNFKIVTCSETQIPPKFQKMVMVPVEGIKLKMEKR